MPGDISTALSVGGALIGTAHAIQPFITKILGPSADELGDHLRLKVRGYLAENTADTVAKAAAMVEGAKAEPKKIPLRSAVPLLEGASHEDDPKMREMWAALIARAAIAGDSETIPPIFAGILAQLTPASAVVLSQLAETTEPFKTLSQGSMSTVGGLDGMNLVYFLEDKLSGEDKARIGEITDVLVRQQLASKTMVFAADKPQGYNIRITELGRRFHSACKSPAVPSR